MLYICNDNGRTFLCVLVDMEMICRVGQFFQRAYTAGENEKYIAERNHFFFPHCQIGDFYQFRNQTVCLFLGNKYLRNDSRYVSARCHGRISHNAHKADTAAAVHERISFFCKKLACHTCKSGKSGIISIAGTAVNNSIFFQGDGSFLLK